MKMLAFHMDQKISYTIDGININFLPAMVGEIDADEAENYKVSFRIVDERGHSRYYFIDYDPDRINDLQRPRDITDPLWRILLAGVLLLQKEIAPEILVSIPSMNLSYISEIHTLFAKTDWEIYGVGSQVAGIYFRFRSLDIHIIPTATAAVYDMMLRDRLDENDTYQDGQISRYEDFANTKRRMTLCYIGNFHSEWITFTPDPFEPISCGICHQALSSIQLEIKTFYQERTKEVFHPIAAEQALLDGYFVFRGRQTDITRLIERGATEAAEKLYSSVKEAMRMSDSSFLFVTGEGVTYMETDLIDLDQEIRIIRGPERSAVRGLWKLGYLLGLRNGAGVVTNG